MNATLAAKLRLIASLVLPRVKLRSHSSGIVTLSMRENSASVLAEEINLSVRCDGDRLISFAEAPPSE